MAHKMEAMIPALIILLTLAIDLYTDTRPTTKVKHLRGALLRVPSFALAAWLNPWSLLLAVTYWAAFDLLFGYIKHRNIWYLGTRAKLDKMQRRYPWLVPVKFVVGVGAVVLYILMV